MLLRLDVGVVLALVLALGFVLVLADTVFGDADWVILGRRTGV